MKKSFTIVTLFLFTLIGANQLSAAGRNYDIGTSWVRYYWNAGNYSTVYAIMSNIDYVEGDNYHGPAKVALDRHVSGVPGWGNVSTKNVSDLKPYGTVQIKSTSQAYKMDGFRTAGKYTQVKSPSGQNISKKVYTNLQ